MASDFRRRRIEKNMTRDDVARKSGVAVSNIVRFEQKGLISLKNLIGIAMALEYTAEIKSVFSQPKYSTMEDKPWQIHLRFRLLDRWRHHRQLQVWRLAVSQGYTLIYHKILPFRGIPFNEGFPFWFFVVREIWR